jgi:hypothetical protein
MKPIIKVCTNSYICVYIYIILKARKELAIQSVIYAGTEASI